MTEEKRIRMRKWNYDGDNVRLEYTDNTVVYVTKEDFNRAFGSIINSSKEDVIKEFGITK